MAEKLSNWLLPLGVFCAALALWEIFVTAKEIPPYVLPAPSLIGKTLVNDWGTLSGSLWVTLRITF